MNFEIYQTKNGNKRVNIGNQSFGLWMQNGQHETVGAPYQPTDCPVTNAYYAACDSIGIQRRCSWHGVMNSLGHVGNVAPPWKPAERDWNRAESS